MRRLCNDGLAQIRRRFVATGERLELYWQTDWYVGCLRRCGMRAKDDEYSGGVLGRPIRALDWQNQCARAWLRHTPANYDNLIGLFEGDADLQCLACEPLKRHVYALIWEVWPGEVPQSARTAASTAHGASSSASGSKRAGGVRAVVSVISCIHHDSANRGLFDAVQPGMTATSKREDPLRTEEGEALPNV